MSATRTDYPSPPCLWEPAPAASTPARPTGPTRLADLVLQDADGKDVRLGDLWSDRPVVLAWLRHYG